MTSSAAALQMLERRQQVLANNLANANTRGFKAQTAFARMIGDAIAATDTSADLSQGTLTETHNALDVSIEGGGFFVVKTPAGERHIRGGAFQLDAKRQLSDAAGNAVLGEDGPMILPTGDISISPNGQVRVRDKVVGRLRLESVAAGAQMVHEGGTMFVPDASRKAIALDDRKIHQGSVEESNVNTMSAMTEMLEVLHRYGAAQKSIATIDSIRGIAVNDLAKPA
ncbi:MAG: flagellar hook-basal body complex protein [Phycisphaerae bacterium]|nr:flagellar hook-basal body complex protein [Gemmatimonadaceae bacterium]